MGIKKIVAVALLAFTLVLLGIFNVVNGSYTRMLLFFDHAHTGRQMTEVRYLKTLTKPLAVHIVDELLLGPVNHDFSSLFVTSSRANRCFVDGSVLYVDVPATAFNIDGIAKASLPKRSFELLKKNVFENCPDIKEIYVYVDGVRIFDYLPTSRVK